MRICKEPICHWADQFKGCHYNCPSLVHKDEYEQAIRADERRKCADRVEMVEHSRGHDMSKVVNLSSAIAAIMVGGE